MANRTANIVDIDALLETAVDVAVEAGKAASEWWARPLQLSSKGYRDIVTDADVSVQKLITDAISSQYPLHGFVTEESDDDLRREGEVKWIIDPIDGTTNFSRQQPMFCISIAGVISGESGSGNGKVVVGVIYDPLRNELFSAATGKGSRMNGRPIRVSPLESMSDWMVGIDWSHRREMRQRTLDALSQFAHEVNTVRAMGSAALALAWVASGRLDAYLNYSVKPWDIAAALLLINEAGGIMSDDQGQPRHWQHHQNNCVASNGHNHGSFLRLINSRPRAR